MRKRLCPHCGYKWDSDTAYAEEEFTPCPKCNQEVPGDSIAKEG